MININFRDPRPIYEQVRDGFVQLIVSGALPPNSKIPSVRELSASLTINPNTIQRAYRELETAGYICAVPGKGSFVCGVDDTARVLKAELEESFGRLAKELRLIGVGENELISIIKGDESQ